MLINPGITREAAEALVAERCDFALQRHLYYVANAMESLCEHFGDTENKDVWYITGLLHDIDWNDTITHSEDHCGEETMNYLESHGVAEEIRNAIQSHCIHFGVPMDTDMKKSLFACDELSGFTVAVAQMRPTKMIGIKSKSVIKKMKAKQFAAQVSREDMKSCEEFFNIPLAEFITILIPGFESIAGEWELV